MSVVGGLNIAGAECHYSPAGQWWAANGVEHPNADHAEIPDRLKHAWAEPFGDRRQAIAFMGINLDSTDLSAQLDACLLDLVRDEIGRAQFGNAAQIRSRHGRPRYNDHECGDPDCCRH